MNLINLQVNNVITLVGAKYSGKSTFAKQAKVYLENMGKSCRIISSADIRKDLLNKNIDDTLNDVEAKLVSDVAFQAIENKLKMYTQCPINIDVIIVDTTAFNTQFREHIANIANDQGYQNTAIIFDVKGDLVKTRITPEQYSEYQLHNKKMRTQVLPKFNSHNYQLKYRITKDTDYQFNFIDHAKVLKLDHCQYKDYGFIGDAHGCIDELKQLVDNLTHHGKTKFLINGDYIDKNTKENIYATIEYIHENVELGRFHIIKGNHEEFVYNQLIGKNKVTDVDVLKNFNTIEHFNGGTEKDKRIKAIFLNLHENSYDFAEFTTLRQKFYVSHAPTEMKYIGKRTPTTLRHMRNRRLERDVSVVEQLNNICKENIPFTHVFGHVEVGKVCHQQNNHIAIDQGCVSGGHLTGMYFNKHDTVCFEYVQNMTKQERIESFKVPRKSLKELDAYEQRVHKRMMKLKPLFISTTVSPTPSNVVDLETVFNCIDYFQKNELNDVIAQTKHMGSRSQIYLYPNLEDCFAISRNGHKLKQATIEAIQPIHDKYKERINELLVLDAEMMTWGVIAKPMIDRQFRAYGIAVEEELNLLEQSKLSTFLNIDIDKQKQSVHAFNEQVELYGTVSDQVYFEIFDVIYHDGVVFHYKEKSYLDDYDIAYQRFDLSDVNDREKLNVMFNDNVKNGKEGIMVKPFINVSDKINMMKVRNQEYLRIIYGYNYLDQIDKFCRNKDIRGKVRTSIKESKLNDKIMEAWLNKDDAELSYLYHAIIVEMATEKTLDPRL